MNKPEFLFRICCGRFPCLGVQLSLILETIHPYVEKLVWYGADAEINGERPFKLGLEGYTPKKIGNFSDMINLVNSVDQFMSGVFFALPADVGSIWNREFGTEDERFRDIEEAILEIRAFDTSYFEIYTSEQQIIEFLQRYFYTELLKKTE